ncbi:MAG: 5'/3'-nucleotidase SurE [Candidatus Glassbacteria bacterium]|nr:5'/3'-nucleotidase SurE [Candidatus Glassbacteria bacterium]
MLFLATNDDGYQAKGLKVLAGILGELGEVMVAAPEVEQSACSHSITLDRPLRVRQAGPGIYAVDGTTTDCVLLASQSLLGHRKPDAVFSGINHGPNLGDDVTYSGTVAGAFEGTLLGVRSLAISAGDPRRLDDRETRDLLAGLIGRLLAQPWPKDVLLNINVPAGGDPVRGVRMTVLGRRHYAETVIEKTDPRGRKYYWIGGINPHWYGNENSDFKAVEDGYISVTPLHLDLTHYSSLEGFKGLEADLNP